MITWSHNYNCASYAVERLNELHNLGIKIENGNEWQASFIPHLRQWFEPIGKPVNGCLVVMKALDGGLHLGVYEDYLVAHNYKPSGGAGGLMRSDLGTIKAEFNKRVRFYGVANRKD